MISVICYNKMSYNDQDSYHLLTWINKERLLIGQTNKIYQFQQLQHSSLIPIVLNQIDHHYFHHILELRFDYKLYLLTIEQYLIQAEDLKFKRHQRQILQDSESISQLVKLILFLIMRHQVKKEFVPRILQLQEESQMYLMCEIRRVETWLENRVQIKQVHQTIEKLEEENQTLNKKLQQIEAKNVHLHTIRTQLQQQNQKLQHQHKKINFQKAEIIDQLGINHPKEYLLIYKDLIIQRNELISSHQKVQSQIGSLTQQNQQIREKITENTFIIDHLNEQINKYKQVLSQYKKSSLSFTKTDKENIDTTLTTFQSVRMIQSVQCNKDKAFDEDHKAVKGFQQEQHQLNHIIQGYQQDLVAKLQEFYVKIGMLNEQISSLKSHNQKIAAQNRMKQKIISESYQQFQQFSFNYGLTINR